MRIKVRLPKVEPDQYDWPVVCPHKGCNGRHFKAHGVRGERKPLRDFQHQETKAYRRKCMRCGGTFRVYPRGVSRGQQSDRLKAMSVLLYVLGLSYGAVEDFVEALGVYISKATVYENVQEAGVVARARQSADVVWGGSRPVIGSDATYVKVKGAEVAVQVVVDDRDGDLLSLEIVSSEHAEEVKKMIQDVAQKVRAEVLVSDDLDTYKRVADETGLDHQICRNHVRRNVDELTEKLREQLRDEEPLPDDPALSPKRILADLDQLEIIVRERPSDGEEQLGRLYEQYKNVRQPSPGVRHPVSYRVRMLITRLWNRWRRLTLDQRRSDLDGTNNSSERLIGWWCKERYRPMRGYKRTLSIKNVVTLTARMGVRSGSYDMTELYA